MLLLLFTVSIRHSTYPSPRPFCSGHYSAYLGRSLLSGETRTAGTTEFLRATSPAPFSWALSLSLGVPHAGFSGG